MTTDTKTKLKINNTKAITEALRKQLEANNPELTEAVPFNPNYRKQSYLEICVDDALYNAPYEVMIQHGKGTEFCGWGLQRPDDRLVSYQRLWEYYVNKETYMEAVIAMYKMSGEIPNLNPSFSGVGFEAEELVEGEYHEEVTLH